MKTCSTHGAPLVCLACLGAAGGAAVAAAMTPEERKDRSRKMNAAGWGALTPQEREERVKKSKESLRLARIARWGKK